MMFGNHHGRVSSSPNAGLNPEWDQFIYIPVHSPREVSAFRKSFIYDIDPRLKVMLLECMDYQNLTKVCVIYIPTSPK